MRSRKAGAGLPIGSIYVGRPTIWGNPFMVNRFGHARSVIFHRQWLDGRIGDLTLERLNFCPSEIEALQRKRMMILQRMHELAGHDLACWCPLSSPWCHAGTYLERAPAAAEFERLAS